MPRATREEQVQETRPVRVPVNEANRNILTVKGLDKDNFYYRWVNDVNDRLAMFVEAGYEFVNKDGNPVGDGGVDNTAGTGSKYSKGVKGGITAYLMRLPKALWLEDQKAKEQRTKELEADMKTNAAKHADYGRLESGSKVTVV